MRKININQIIKQAVVIAVFWEVFLFFSQQASVTVYAVTDGASVESIAFLWLVSFFTGCAILLFTDIFLTFFKIRNFFAERLFTLPLAGCSVVVSYVVVHMLTQYNIIPTLDNLLWQVCVYVLGFSLFFVVNTLCVFFIKQENVTARKNPSVKRVTITPSNIKSLL